MKRYRYGNPSSLSVLQKARPYILLFVGWNLAGAMIWKYANSRASGTDEDWYSKPQVERIATLTGTNAGGVKRYTFPLASNDENSETDTKSS